MKLRKWMSEEKMAIVLEEKGLSPRFLLGLAHYWEGFSN